MEYELRKVNAMDLMLVTTIIAKLGVRELKECFQGQETRELIASLAGEENKETALTSVGVSVAFDIAGVVLGNMAKCQNELFQLLANVSNKKVSEIASMGGTDFLEMLVEVIKDNSGDFIGVASKLFNLKK